MNSGQLLVLSVACLLLFLPGLFLFYFSKFKTPFSVALGISVFAVFLATGVWAGLSRFIDLPFNLVICIALYASVLTVMWLLAGKIKAREFVAPELLGIGNFLVLIGSLIGLQVSWVIGMSDRVVVGNHDAFNHAAFVGNIANFETLSPSFAHFHPVSGLGTSNFYPFGFHAFAAAIVEVTGFFPSAVVLALTQISATILLPLGVYLLGVFTDGGSKSLGVLAISCLIPLYLFPYGILGWGGVTMLIGIVTMLCLVGVVIWIAREFPSLFIPSFILALFALALLHSSEAFMFPIFLTFLGWKTLRKTFFGRGHFLGLGVSVLFLIFPYIERFLGYSAISDLALTVPNESPALYQALGQILLLTPGLGTLTIWPLIFLLGGIIAIANFRKVNSVLHLYIFLFVCTAVASRATQPWFSDFSHALAPWYRQFQRLSYFMVPVVALIGGVLLLSIISFFTKNLSQRRALVSTFILSLVLSSLIFATSISPSSAVLKGLTESFSMHSAKTLNPPLDSLGIREDDTILAAFDSGIGYWAIDSRNRVLGAPFIGAAIVPSQELLLDAIPYLASRSDVRDAYSSLNVKYVVTNTRSMSGFVRPSIPDMTNSRSFDQIWSEDGVAIWRPRQVSTDWNGSVTGWVTQAGKPTARLMTEPEVKLSLFNWSESTLKIRAKLVFRQNICKSVNGVTVGSDFYPVRRLKHVNLTLDLDSRQQLDLPIKASGTTCLDPETSLSSYLSLLPIETETLK